MSDCDDLCGFFGFVPKSAAHAMLRDICDSYVMSHDVCVAIRRHDDFHIGSCQRRNKSFEENMSLFCGDTDSAYLITLGGKGFLSQTGEASFGLLSDRQVCDMVMTLFHELRHVSQYEHIAFGHDIGREVEAGVIIGDYDYSYYQQNHHLLAHEYDAERYGVVEAFDVLRDAWGDARATRAMTMSLRRLKTLESDDKFHPAISLANYDETKPFDVEVYKEHVRQEYDHACVESRVVSPMAWSSDGRVIRERLNAFTGTCMRLGRFADEFSDVQPGVNQDIYVASAILAIDDMAAGVHRNFPREDIRSSVDYARRVRAQLVGVDVGNDVDRDAIGHAAMRDAAGMRAASDDFARDFGP